ncbi:MAG: pyruvate kinase [Thermomicrobiales bacterium]
MSAPCSLTTCGQWLMKSALVPILFDLRGLKIRTGPLANPAEESVGIPRGGTVTIVNTAAPTTNELIGIDFPQLFEFIHPGSRILISDGLIELLVERIDGKTAQCHVGAVANSTAARA